MPGVKYLSLEDGEKIDIDNFPSFHKSGSITGMKKRYYGKDALLVRCEDYIYNVTAKPEIYQMASDTAKLKVKPQSTFPNAKVLKKIGPWTIEIFTGHIGRKKLVVCSSHGFHVDYPIIYDDKTVAWGIPQHVPVLVKRWVRDHSSELYDLLRARGFKQKGKGKQLKYADYWNVKKDNY